MQLCLMLLPSNTVVLLVICYWPENDGNMSKSVATINYAMYISLFDDFESFLFANLHNGIIHIKSKPCCVMLSCGFLFSYCVRLCLM